MSQTSEAQASEAKTSENAGTIAASSEELDALALSALLSSRLCHDLINPVGAVGSGLEVLDDPQMDAAMREAAMDLVRSGASKAIAVLSYARLAYGSAGGLGAQISLVDAQKALAGLYESSKADLTWKIGDGYAAKENVKVLLILGAAAADSVPRGGEVSITGDINDFTITATGKKVLLQDTLVKALSGDTNEIQPKFAPAHIAWKLVKEAGGRLTARLENEIATFTASFPKT